jgi:uncharacterized membrane protein
MTEEHPENHAGGLTKSRLEGLSDGIFAFAMTLLVIGVNVPDKATLVQTNSQVIQVLLSLRSDFLHYVLAFLILGAFWLGHHSQLHVVKNIDRTYIWINLLMLLCVALLPFSTSFSGDFPDASYGSIVFQLNLFAIGMALFCQWKYATGGKRLTEPGLSPSYIKKVSIRSLAVPGVSVVCILVALTGNLWSSALYMSLPLVDYLVERTFS